MAAPIQSPAKCEVRSVLRFLNAKMNVLAEIHKQTVAVCGNFMNQQNVMVPWILRRKDWCSRRTK